MQLTTSDLIVLSVILYENPMHGYGLVKRLDESNLQEWAAVSRAQVYYSLKKLVNAGFLEPAQTGTDASGPERASFRPAVGTADAFRKELTDESWVHDRTPSKFVTWAVLAVNGDNRTINKQIDARIAYLEAELMQERQTLGELENSEGRHVVIARAVIELAIAQFEAELSQIEHLRTSLIK